MTADLEGSALIGEVQLVFPIGLMGRSDYRRADWQGKSAVVNVSYSAGSAAVTRGSRTISTATAAMTHNTPATKKAGM